MIDTRSQAGIYSIRSNRSPKEARDTKDDAIRVGVIEDLNKALNSAAALRFLAFVRRVLAEKNSLQKIALFFIAATLIFLASPTTARAQTQISINMSSQQIVFENIASAVHLKLRVASGMANFKANDKQVTGTYSFESPADIILEAPVAGVFPVLVSSPTSSFSFQATQASLTGTVVWAQLTGGDAMFSMLAGTLKVSSVAGAPADSFMINEEYPISIKFDNFFTVQQLLSGGFANAHINSGVLAIPSLELIGLEVTQGIQDLRNSVPLVTGKHTFVRAHVKAPSAAFEGLKISGFLTAKNPSNESVFGTMTNSNITIATQNPQRDAVQDQDSLSFEIPDTWTQGNVEFEVGLNQGSLACNEPDGTPDCKATVTFQPVSPFSIKFVLLTYNDATGTPHTPTARDVHNVVKEFLGRYPINDFDGDVCWAKTKLNPCADTIDDDPNFVGLRKELNDLRNEECKNRSCKQFYMGLLADKSDPKCRPGELNGEGDLPGHASAVFVDTDDTTPRVHEQGHVMGLRHTNFTGREGCEDTSGRAVPCTKLEGDGTLSLSKDPYGPDTAYGFDVNNSSPALIYPAQTPDFMSYGRPRWPSRWNYIQLFNDFKVSGTVAPGESIGGRAKVVEMSAAQTVLIDGSLLLDGSEGEIGSVYVSQTPGTIVLPSPGAYAIRLENAQEVELAAYSFDPVAGSESPMVGTFSIQLPWNVDAKRIVLLRNGAVLASRQASANPPKVTVTFPNGGETLSGASTTFAWSANDPDGDVLTYALDYSTDNGTTWKALAINWNSTSFPVDLTKLPGSNQALIRVTASDGFNSAQGQSNAVFNVPSHGPEAFISTPENNHLYVGGQTIILEGMALDIEDGFLDGSRLTWTSNLNGMLGTGGSLTINAMNLQEGTHIITLSASDSTARVGSAVISIRVFRIRPVLPATLSVGPTQLAFEADFGTGQTATQNVAIRNGGDGNLRWSATADQSWIRLGVAAGLAPSNLSVTANATGRFSGEYIGHVTIMADGAAGGPQIVNVNLVIPPCTSALSPANASFPPSGGNGTVNFITTTSACA